MLESVTIASEASYGPAAQRLEALRPINFIYGANGSGKTTISRVIAAIENYPTCTLSWQGGRALECLVYNQDFVRDTFNSRMPGIFTLGEENRTVLDRIDECRVAIADIKLGIDNRQHTLGGIDGAGGEFGKRRIARTALEEKCWKLKTKYDEIFQPVFTGFRAAKPAFCDKVLLEQSNSAELFDVDTLKKKVATIFDKGLENEPLIAPLSPVETDFNETSEILSKRVIGKEDVDIAALIRRLGNSDWVKQGIEYLPAAEGACPFCQQSLPSAFEAMLNEYFDETFAREIAVIERLTAEYRDAGARALQTIEAVVTVSPKYLDCEAARAVQERLRERLEANLRMLDRKKKEPSSVVALDATRPLIDEYNGLVEAANVDAKAQNDLLADIAAQRAKTSEQVWRMIVDEAQADIDSHNAEQNSINAAITGLTTGIQGLQDQLAATQAELNQLEESITSVEPTVRDINSLLKQFGFLGFTLRTAGEGQSQYEIVRENGGDATPSLSEGEKTFVTFLYFYHSLRGSTSASGVTENRVVVIDDPVSSLDSDVLFVVSSLIKRLLKEACEGNSHLKQVIVLTHNIYFHKEVAFDPHRGSSCRHHETFWIVKKRDDVSLLERFDHNPISTAYELLWAEVRNPARSKLSIQNTLRRILENYFKILGNLDRDWIVEKFEGQDKMICASLFSWVNDGSHGAHDDLYLTSDSSTVDKYLRVFREIFERSEHGAHYNMMMGPNGQTSSQATEPAPQSA